MSRLLDHIIAERNGHYCHTLELDSVYSYESVIEQIVSEYKDSFTLEEIKEFFIVFLYITIMMQIVTMKNIG